MAMDVHRGGERRAMNTQPRAQGSLVYDGRRELSGKRPCAAKFRGVSHATGRVVRVRSPALTAHLVCI